MLFEGAVCCRADEDTTGDNCNIDDIITALLGGGGVGSKNEIEGQRREPILHFGAEKVQMFLTEKSFLPPKKPDFYCLEIRGHLGLSFGSRDDGANHSLFGRGLLGNQPWTNLEDSVSKCN